MKILMLPDWREGNPYQDLLAEELKRINIEVIFPSGYKRGLPFSRSVLGFPKPSLLHLHWPTPYLRSSRVALRVLYGFRTLFDLAIVRAFGVRIVWTVHNLVSHDTSAPKFERWFSAQLARLANRLIVHTEDAEQEVARRLKVDPEKMLVIPHGSFLQKYGEAIPKMQARKLQMFPNEGKIALFFGQIRPYKGVDKLLEAWRKIKPRKATPTLLIAGFVPDVKYRHMVELLAEDLEGVRLDLRHIPDSEVACILSCADFMVLPFNDSLTSGTVQLACDYNLPIIASRNPGTSVSSGVRYFGSENGHSLEETLDEVLSDGHTLTTIEGPKISWSKIALLHAKLYREVLLAG